MNLLLKKILFFICVFFIFGVTAQNPLSNSLDVSNDNPLKTDLDKAINKSARSYFKDPKAVGLSIGILLNGKAYFYNYGELESGKKTLPTNKTIYEIGSITKTFTGIALAQAVLEKKINIQDDIRKYLKDSYPNLEYKGEPIRIINLTNHTSRITRIFPNNWERNDYIPENPFANYSREMFFEGLHHMKMDTLAGVKYEYSNMAVALLGIILEGVNHQNYFTFISKQILEPLNMKNTTIDLSKIDKKMIAKSHNEKKEVVPYWDLPALPAMGSLRSNTSDMVKYIEANNKDSLPGMALSHQFTFAGDEGDMGFNWFMHTTPEGIRYYEHTGGTGGARSSLQCFPASNSGFIILTNSLANRKMLEKDLYEIILNSR